jgi:hypothetical protein
MLEKRLRCKCIVWDKGQVISYTGFKNQKGYKKKTENGMLVIENGNGAILVPQKAQIWLDVYNRDKVLMVDLYQRFRDDLKIKRITGKVIDKIKKTVPKYIGVELNDEEKIVKVNGGDFADWIWRVKAL